MAATSAELLSEAENLYHAARTNHRDALLEVGRVLHLYILARLEEAVGLPEKKRGEALRKCAIRDAAARLGTKMNRVRQLAAAAVTVDLLGDGGPLGRLGIASIKILRVVIRRVSQGRNRVTDPRDRERWFVKARCRGWAKDLFSRAAREGWGQKRVKEELDRLMPLRHREPPLDQPSQRKEGARRTRRRRLSATNRPPVEANGAAAELSDMQRVARVGTPHDVAEALFPVIRESQDPRAVVRFLTQMVAALPKPRPTLVG